MSPSRQSRVDLLSSSVDIAEDGGQSQADFIVAALQYHSEACNVARDHGPLLELYSVVPTPPATGHSYAWYASPPMDVARFSGLLVGPVTSSSSLPRYSYHYAHTGPASLYPLSPVHGDRPLHDALNSPSLGIVRLNLHHAEPCQLPYDEEVQTAEREEADGK